MKANSIPTSLCRWLGVFTLAAAWLISASEASASWFTKPAVVTSKWGIFEQSFKSSIDYDNPLGDVSVSVVFTSPLGDTHKVWGFWDGGKIWRVRFSPDFPGKWKYRTVCSDAANNSLNDLMGEFVCTASTEESVFDQHGPVQVARDHRHLEYADHTSFFWLADNVGKGALHATPAEWNFYAEVRAKEKFTAAQWVASPGGNANQLTTFTGTDHIKINLDFFKAMDAKVAALNRAGILDVIEPLVESGSATNLTDSQAILLVRYMVARWDANDVAWLLPCGDGKVPRWKKIGQAVFADVSHALVVLNPGDAFWVLEDFRSERWVDVFGYQTAHDMTDDATQWLLEGPVSKDWTKYPPRPYINLSPAYENEAGASGQPRISAETIRRTAGWSLLTTPTAGIGYGAHGVADWNTATNLASPDVQVMTEWQAALYLPGAKQLGLWAQFFSTIDFGQLRPAPKLIVNQSSSQSPRSQIAAAATDFGDLALIYLPEGGDVELRGKSLPPSPNATWVNGRTGEQTRTALTADGNTTKLSAPGSGDWFLLLQSGKK